MSAGARAALRALLALSRWQDGQDGGEGRELRALMRAVLGALTGLVLFVSLLTSILTSPFEWADEAGQLQARYADTQAADAALSDAEIAALTADAADDAEQALAETALSLVGKVSYFWGGKSAAGWNDAWGEARIVTAPGSSTTGTVRPYGLDCSGFTAWVYATSGCSDALMGRSAAGQAAVVQTIEREELRPGDLAFHRGSGGRIDHVGIFLRWEGDTPMYVHCSFSAGGVVYGAYSGFTEFGHLDLDRGETT